MKVHNDSNFLIYFGDDSESVKLSKEDLHNNLKEVLLGIQQKINAKGSVFLKQVHGTNGIVVSKESKLKYPLDIPDEHGDIIITDRDEVGIGILTADCLPVVFYDRSKHVLAVAHAGWKGSVAGVSKRTLQMMHDRFKSDPADIEVHFGPAARSCCYEVQRDFLKHLSRTDIDHEHCLMHRKGKLFLDLSKFNKHQLVNLGVKEQNIQLKHHECTICNINYCSYRRDKEDANRQVTLAMLK
ncbi:peptidoglycan editing factor PgeF [Candidatus Babeliales bacterium]|nr:peptidoglycan editing factor PgeF [Candidatus Babeliales bacterium]